MSIDFHLLWKSLFGCAIPEPKTTREERAMTRRWPIVLGLIAGLAALWAGLQAGSDQNEGWQLAARWTARVGFPIFILTYTASSLAKLWPGELTRGLWRDRRWWGLGFAACHTVHLYALVTYTRMAGNEVTTQTLIGGGGAYAIMYLMALTSNEASMRALGKNWKRLHKLGIHWLWFIFAFTYFGRIVEGQELPYAGITFAAALAALGLRITVWIKGRRARAATA
jgi:methionine sulfoxide reductase heme-binding subunit